MPNLAIIGEGGGWVGLQEHPNFKFGSFAFWRFFAPQDAPFPSLSPSSVLSSLPPFSFYSAPLPSSRHHLSSDDCLEDKRDNYQNCCVLCTPMADVGLHNDMTKQFLQLGVGLGLVFVFV